MTCEDIIQRLLDERHITVKEAMIMIKALVKNLINEPEKEEPLKWPPQEIDIKDGPIKKVNPFWEEPPAVVMYGITTPGLEINDIKTNISTYNPIEYGVEDFSNTLAKDGIKTYTTNENNKTVKK